MDFWWSFGFDIRISSPRLTLQRMSNPLHWRGDSNDAASDCSTRPADGRDSVSVRPVRHGRGLILIGVLLALLPLPSAMVLHAITQIASNGWRAFLWRGHLRGGAGLVFLIGCAGG